MQIWLELKCDEVVSLINMNRVELIIPADKGGTKIYFSASKSDYMVVDESYDEVHSRLTRAIKKANHDA